VRSRRPRIRLRKPRWFLIRNRFRVAIAGSPSLQVKEVMGVRRYLLVLDMDLLAMDQEHGLEPINHLVAKQEQEPCEVVVLSLVTNQPKIHIERLAGAGIPRHPDLAHQPDDDISAHAEHRMERAVQHLKMIGCRASGIITYEDLVTAVRSETRGHDYDEVILATGRREGSELAHLVGRDAVGQLRRKWGQRLIVFSGGHGQGSSS
jgi:hypothetical protein